MIYFYWNYWTCECIVIPLSCDYSINCLLEVVPYWDKKYYKLNCLEFLILLHIDGLTHWGRVTYICISKLIIIGSYKSLSPGRRQAIIWTNAGILLIRTSGTNFNEVLSKIETFSFKKIHLKMPAKWQTFCLSFNVLTHWGRDKVGAISQTTFSSTFSWMKMFEFRLEFHWSLFLRVQFTIFQHWFRWWLGTVQATSHYLKQWWLIYWRIYASLGLNELMQKRRNSSVLAEVLCLFSNEAINIIQSNENQNWVQRWVFVSYRYENLSIHGGNG